MGREEFVKYIEKQSVDEEDEVIDWDKKKDEWLGDLKKFYVLVKSFLNDFFETKKVSLDEETITIDEELIGKYDVKKLMLYFKNNKVVFEPIGTNLIGAKGRVDMIGSVGTVRFVLVPENSEGPGINIKIQAIVGEKEVEKTPKDPETEWKWKIATEPPHIRYLELTEDSFFDSLMKVTNG